jgi:hypothetical protein
MDKMEKRNKPKATPKKPWLIVGSLLILVMIGTAGCGSSGTSTQSTSQAQTNQGQANQGQPGQGQRVRNPAQQAAMEIRRLQNNQQNALTSDQKAKIKPILQDLINTASPSQDFLQQKADAINAVLTAQQKSYLATATKRPGNGNNQNSNSQSNQSNSKGNNNSGVKTQGGNGGQRGSFNPQDIYQQVLDSLK